MKTQNSYSHFSSRADGFTLVEIIAVLLIIAIVSVIVVSRIGDTKADIDAYADTLKTHIRYAQSRAMNSDKVWGITHNGTVYFLFSFDGNAQFIVRLPGEENNVVKLADIGFSLGAFTTVSFNSWGSPFNNATGTGTSTGLEITVSSGSLSSDPIKITKNTGFIP